VVGDRMGCRRRRWGRPGRAVGHGEAPRRRPMAITTRSRAAPPPARYSPACGQRGYAVTASWTKRSGDRHRSRSSVGLEPGTWRRTTARPNDQTADRLGTCGSRGPRPRTEVGVRQAAGDRAASTRISAGLGGRPCRRAHGKMMRGAEEAIGVVGRGSGRGRVGRPRHGPTSRPGRGPRLVWVGWRRAQGRQHRRGGPGGGNAWVASRGGQAAGGCGPQTMRARDLAAIGQWWRGRGRSRRRRPPTESSWRRYRHGRSRCAGRSQRRRRR